MVWQRAGYVSANVWTALEGLISKDLLPSTEDITRVYMTSTAERGPSIDVCNDPVVRDVTTDDDQQDKLQKTDRVNERLIAFVAKNMFPSKRKQLALGLLQLSEKEYEALWTKWLNSYYINFKVILPSVLADYILNCSPLHIYLFGLKLNSS